MKIKYQIKNILLCSWRNNKNNNNKNPQKTSEVIGKVNHNIIWKICFPGRTIDKTDMVPAVWHVTYGEDRTQIKTQIFTYSVKGL